MFDQVGVGAVLQRQLCVLKEELKGKQLGPLPPKHQCRQTRTLLRHGLTMTDEDLLDALRRRPERMRFLMVAQSPRTPYPVCAVSTANSERGLLRGSIQHDLKL